MRILTFFLCLIFTARLVYGQPSAIWIEGENPTSATVRWEKSSAEHHEFLSQDSWLLVNIDTDKVQDAIPADGALIIYKFDVGQAGDYHLWQRIGFEFVRSPYEWRVDNGPWTKVSSDDLTTDLMSVGFWAEVAWWPAGKVALAAGSHSLDFRLSRTPDASGKPDRVLFALDAICLSQGEFTPYQNLKPGETGQTDADKQAAKQVFDLPEATSPGARSSVDLNGPWEICRNDEQAPGEVNSPIKDFPPAPHWSGIPVPSDRNVSRPDLLFAHRLWYRTRVNVPASQAGRSFYLTMPENSLNTTVYANGTYCGFSNAPFAPMQIDLSAAIKPGLNEIWVGIRDAWYARAANPDKPLKLRKTFNIPLSMFHEGFQDLSYPIWNLPQSGILKTPVFSSAGSTYASDVFTLPSVANKQMSVQVTLHNAASTASTVEVVCEALDDTSNQVEWTGPKQTASIEPGKEMLVTSTGPWENAKLWWPDDPNLYRLRTTVTADGKPVDVSETRFGFHEWSSEGIHFKLNGVTWHGHCDETAWDQGDIEGSIANWKAKGLNLFRLRYRGDGYLGMPVDSFLSKMDENGVITRIEGILDGEAMGYRLVTDDPDLKAKFGTELNMDLIHNAREQLLANVKALRNHPSVGFWTLDNEFFYINSYNLLHDDPRADQNEAEWTKTAAEIRSVAPNAFPMTEGGGAFKANTLPVHGDHYLAIGSDRILMEPYKYYDRQTGVDNGAARGRWAWDEKQPRFLSEDYYADGIPTGDFAALGGPDCFQGKSASRPTISRLGRMIMEAYRWVDMGAVDFALPEKITTADMYKSFSPVAVFAHEWDSTFESNQSVKRTFKIFNDTRSSDPITFTYTLTVDGKVVATRSSEHHVAPGEAEESSESITLPQVDKREEATLDLVLQQGGKEVFRDQKVWSVLNTSKASPDLRKLSSEAIAIYDPANTAATFLKGAGVPLTILPSLNTIPKGTRVLVVGKDAIDSTLQGSTKFAAFAAQGGRVLVLEQKMPLQFQALVSATIETTDNAGTAAFAEDMDHPAFANLQQHDLFAWGEDGYVYRNAYKKPVSGAISLAQCHLNLADTALVQIPINDGLLVLSQFLIEEKLNTVASARQALLNLVKYAVTYKQVFRPTAVCLTDTEFAHAVDLLGVKYTPAASVLEAISSPNIRLAIITATPAALHLLVEASDKVKDFTSHGGYIVLQGLTPEGLADFNKLVGVEHMIRPFRRERVSIPLDHSKLTAGLGVSDLQLFSPDKIPFSEQHYISSDTFSYVVDVDDVASFGKFNNDFFYNLVCGMTSADGWQYIVNSPDKEYKLTFDHPLKLTQVTWTPNVLYNTTGKIDVVFDNNEAAKVTASIPPGTDPVVVPINPAREATQVIFRHAEFTDQPDKKGILGCDALSVRAERPADFTKKVRPLLNVGGLVEYPQGTGGIVLCNLLIKATEPTPGNDVRKRNVVGTLLHNLHAPFGGGKAIIAGSNLNYTPVDLSKLATNYRTERGWFGDSAFTLASLPTGKQTFSGVDFNVYEFATSPVPTVLMLSGSGLEKAPLPLPDHINNIPVNRKVDALFFLQSARIDQHPSDDDRQKGARLEVCRYLIHFASGKTETLPIYADIDIGDFKVKEPQALPGAQLAWSAPYGNTGFSAAVYSKQWNNPHPEDEITTIDMGYGPDHHGVPALLALSAANSRISSH